MHKPKAFLPLVALSLHRMLHPLLFPRLLKPVADTVERGSIELDWETNGIKKTPPPKKRSNAPATQWQGRAVWKVQCSCLYFCNSMSRDRSLQHGIPVSKSRVCWTSSSSVVDKTVFYEHLWRRAPLHYWAEALETWSVTHLCSTCMECMRVVLKQPV